MSKAENTFDKGLEVLEMTRTPGWKWLESEIKNEIEVETSELRNFSVEGRTAEEIASEYLQHRANLNAYENVLAKVETAIAQKDDAARQMRDSADEN